VWQRYAQGKENVSESCGESMKEHRKSQWTRAPVPYGTMNTYLNAPEMPLHQANIPPEPQGRVMPLMSAVALATYSIGLIVAAPIVSRFSVRLLLFFFFFGGGLVLTCLYALVPRIRNLESSPRKDKAS
jgi:hypothetical protein